MNNKQFVEKMQQIYNQWVEKTPDWSFQRLTIEGPAAECFLDLFRTGKFTPEDFKDMGLQTMEDIQKERGITIFIAGIRKDKNHTVENISEYYEIVLQMIHDAGIIVVKDPQLLNYDDVKYKKTELHYNRASFLLRIPKEEV